jgi:hypothetical protein
MTKAEAYAIRALTNMAMDSTGSARGVMTRYHNSIDDNLVDQSVKRDAWRALVDLGKAESILQDLSRMAAAELGEE